MFLDNLVQLSSAQAIGAVTTNVASTSIYDVTGAGSGNAPNMIGGVTSSGAALIGFDIGTGDGFAIPEVFWNVTTAFSTAGATLQVKLQAAPDNGSNAPGAWTDIYASKAFSGSELTAGYNNQFQIPPVPSDFGETQPRFYRAVYVTGTASFTAGAVSANIVLNPSQATRIQNYPSNFVA